MSPLAFIPLSISATSLSHVISLPHTFCLLKPCIYRSHSPFSSSIHCVYLPLSLSVSLMDRAQKGTTFPPQYLWFHLLFRPLFSSTSKPRQMSHRFFLRSLTAKTNRAMYRMRSQVKNYQMKQQKYIRIMCLQSGRISASAITVLSECVLYEMGFTGFHLLCMRESGAE